MTVEEEKELLGTKEMGKMEANEEGKGGKGHSTHGQQESTKKRKGRRGEGERRRKGKQRRERRKERRRKGREDEPLLRSARSEEANSRREEAIESILEVQKGKIAENKEVELMRR